MPKAKIGLKHNVSYQLRDKNGELKFLFQENILGRVLLRFGLQPPQIPFLFGTFVKEKKVENLVTDAGKAGVAARIIDNTTEAAFDYVAIGTGTTAAAAGDTALESEITTGGGERTQDASPTRETTDVTNDTSVVDVTFNFTSSFAVTESGLLNAASGGTLLARQVFSAINVENGDTLTITWKVDID